MAIILQLLLALLAGSFIIYVVLEMVTTRKCFRHSVGTRQKSGTEALSKEGAAEAIIRPLPTVGVLLPVYNEKLVVEKLIEAVSALKYPKDRLDILLLDDSTDETSAIASALVRTKQGAGVPIRIARRGTRIGYKAGNLKFGLSLVRGDFIAIFDADCLPPADFLLRVIPRFRDSSVGFLQTGIAYANADASFLTRFQAVEAGHKEDVTTGLEQNGCMASLTGSSCVWRRECIESIGGISSDTITEDVDMGLAAQLRTWRYVFVRDVVSIAELPESMSAFRVQRQRWARGLVENALRHAGRLLHAPMPLWAKLNGMALVFSPMLLAAFYALLLLCLPMAFSTAELGGFFHICCTLFLIAAILWTWGNTSGDGGSPCRDGGDMRHASAGDNSLRNIAHVFDYAVLFIGYVFMFMPLSLYYFSALVQVLAGIGGGFHRTPKGRGRKVVLRPRIDAVLQGLEVCSLLYALAATGVALCTGNAWVVLYGVLATGGFSMALFFSLGDSFSRPADAVPRCILITGATGAIGGALAITYAAPEVKLILQGRRRDRLEELATECRSRGASVECYVLELSQTDTVRRWARELAEKDCPDLVIANAGRNTDTGPDNEGEDFEEARMLVEVNLLANMAIVDGILPSMRQRRSGQIAIVSSLASYYGLYMTPTYCATKAALRVWGTALRAGVAREGVRINVILPGYVRSSMCDDMPGPKPCLWQPVGAARTIKRGLARDWARIAFPFPLNFACWGLSVLPAFLAEPIAKLCGYGR